MEVSGAVGALGADRLPILFVEGPYHVSLEGFVRVEVERDEAKAIEEIIFCENSIVDALEFGVEVDSTLEILFLGFAQKSTQHVVDGELALPAIVQQVESPLNFLEPVIFDLPLEVID